MNVAIKLALSLVIEAVLVLIALTFRDPLPPIIVAALLWPVIYVFLLTRGNLGSSGVDYLQLRNYSNVEQIRRQTDRIK